VVEAATCLLESIGNQTRNAGGGDRFAIAALLFLLTLISTLVVGASFAASYAVGRSPEIDGFLFDVRNAGWRIRDICLPGFLFAFTLLGILLGHEWAITLRAAITDFGQLSLFFPAPTLIGTLGAFIRIRSPILQSQGAFRCGPGRARCGISFRDSGPGHRDLLFKSNSFSQTHPSVVFGNPLALRILLALLRQACQRATCCCIRWDRGMGRPVRDFTQPAPRRANSMADISLRNGEQVSPPCDACHRAALIPLGYLFWPDGICGLPFYWGSVSAIPRCSSNGAARSHAADLEPPLLS